MTLFIDLNRIDFRNGNFSIFEIGKQDSQKEKADKGQLFINCG
jgi:hypothetical protein